MEELLRAAKGRLRVMSEEIAAPELVQGEKTSQVEQTVALVAARLRGGVSLRVSQKRTC